MNTQDTCPKWTCTLASALWLFMMLIGEPARADHDTAYANVLSGNTSYYSGDYLFAEGFYFGSFTLHNG
jgi:hypothetical protein